MTDIQNMRSGPSVAAAELVRNFAHWREIGAREPVLITHHGRRTHVFMAIDRFETLSQPGSPPPAQDGIRELASRIHQGLILCDHDLRIVFVNPVALAMTKRWDRQMEGQMLWDALPEFVGTLTEAHIRHSLTSGETSAADSPSPFRRDSWLHFETFPFADGVALLLRDITADMQSHRLADVKSGILKAMNVLGNVGYIRLSARGFIETADATFCAMVGLTQERLASASLPDLIDLPSRPALREALERVLRGEGDRVVTTRFLTNAGPVVEVEAGLAQLRGTYGTEGAIMVIMARDRAVQSENTGWQKPERARIA
ncbi:PAS domain-containing protein [Sphingobium sp. AN558]|uniref:PAS domain-containing protein n=1 Tax=Sphingobium sp. AN558 TaxID=3133442 RepID=UPI0030BB160F